MARLVRAAVDDVAVVAPLERLDGDLVVASYNLLAPLFVRPIDKRTGAVQPFAAFAWVPDDVLAWPARRDALAAQVRRVAATADVVCLQEVEFEGSDRAPPAWLVDALGDGWTVTPPPPRDLERHAQRNERVLGRATAVAACVCVGRGWRVAWTGEGNATQRVLVGVAKGDGAEVAVASAHLDAGSEEKRVGMVLGIMDAARSKLGGGRNLRLVIAGDLNAELDAGSALGAMVGDESADGAARAAARRRACAVALRREPSDGDLGAWAELLDKARTRTAAALRGGLLQRVPLGPTRAGHDHEAPDFPASPRMATWKLDHVLCTPALRPAARWASLEADAPSRAAGLPNASWPSDHYPVAAALALPGARGDPAETDLSEAAGAALRDLAVAEAAAIRAFEADDAADADADAAAAAAAPPSSGKKKPKPPPDVIERKKRRRKRKQDLAKASVTRRRAFAAALDPGDYDVVEAKLLRFAPSPDPVEAWCAASKDGDLAALLPPDVVPLPRLT